MAMSRNEIAALAKGAGFKSMDAATMVAIAYAESGGNPNAHNNKPPDDSYGLWQINMRGKLGPDRRKKFGLKDNTDLYDPATNARVAYGIYKAQGLDAWTTYTRGTYLKYMDGMTTEEGGNKGVAGTIAEINPLNGVPAAINNSVNAVSGTLLKAGSNLAGILVGITFVTLGVLLLMRGQVAQVLPTGKAAKIAKGVLTK